MQRLEPILHQLKDAIEEQVTLQKISAEVKRIDAKLKEETARRDELHDLVRRSEGSLNAIEGKGIKSMFYNILGSKEEKIEEDRKEYLNASLQYNDCQKSIELLEFEVDILRGKLDKLEEVKNKVIHLKKLREKEILNLGNSPVKVKLVALLNELDDTVVLTKEYNEAFGAGKAALGQVNVVLQHLHRAKQWGEWDMGAKTNQASYMKYTSIDRANQHLPRTQMYLDKFRAELRDVNVHNFNFNIVQTGYMQFNRMFFDNIITDWVELKKLRNSILAVSEVYNSIRSLLNIIEQNLQELTVKHDNLIIQKDELILQD